MKAKKKKDSDSFHIKTKKINLTQQKEKPDDADTAREQIN